MRLTLAERIKLGEAPEFFQQSSGPEFLNPSLHEAMIGEPGLAALKAQLMQEHAQRIAEELSVTSQPITQSTRGAAREVICLTLIDPDNPRRLKRYRTVSQAALAVGQKCDNVSQAIRRNGTCGRHKYQYSCDLPRDFDESAVVRSLRVQSIRRQRGGRLFRCHAPRFAACA